MEITDELSILPEEGFNGEKYVNRQFRLDIGKTMEVVLACRNERIRDVIVHFCEEVETWVSDEDHFRVRTFIHSTCFHLL